jgi:hypothetical protein
MFLRSFWNNAILQGRYRPFVAFVLCSSKCLIFSTTNYFVFIKDCLIHGTIFLTNTLKGLSWPWSHDSWIYNYLCNQCLSPLMLLVLESRSGRGVQHYVIKFVSDSRKVCGFLRLSGFLQQKKWRPQYNWNIVESGIKHNQTN